MNGTCMNMEEPKGWIAFPHVFPECMVCTYYDSKLLGVFISMNHIDLQLL